MRLYNTITCTSLSFLALLMTGCGNRMLTHEVNEEIHAQTEELDNVAAQFPQTAPLVEIIDGQYLGVKKVKLAEPLPKALKQGVILTSIEPRNIEHIAERITRLTHIPVRLAPDLYLLPGKSDITDARDTTLRAITYEHDGPLHLFLDNISGRLGITWQYTQGRIRFSRLITRVFQIHLLPGDTRFEASVGGNAQASDEVLDAIGGGEQATLDASGGGTGSASGNDVNQVTQISSAPKKWQELTETVKSLLSPLGQAKPSMGTGVIVVTDTADTIKRIADYIDSQNTTMTRQVAFEVGVFAVAEDRDADTGINWDGVFQNNDVNVNLATPLVAAGPSSIATQIVRPSSNFVDTRVIIKALSANRNVSTVTSAQLVTVNNQPVTEQVTSTVGYLRAVANIVTGATGVSETELQPGQLKTGFVITLTPRVLDDDRMLIRFSASLSSLIRLNEQSSGSATIQIPEIDERAFLQEVIMRSGESLVLSGFEQAIYNDNRQGLGHFNNFLFGNRKAQRDRTRIVITITPTLI